MITVTTKAGEFTFTFDHRWTAHNDGDLTIDNAAGLMVAIFHRGQWVALVASEPEL